MSANIHLDSSGDCFSNPYTLTYTTNDFFTPNKISYNYFSSFISQNKVNSRFFFNMKSSWMLDKQGNEPDLLTLVNTILYLQII